MLACGSSTGQVSVFQIQKEHPPDLNLVTPLTKPKPVERFEVDYQMTHVCGIGY